MIYVFIIQFINTGPILLLINANLENSSIPFMNFINNGVHSDFTNFWYRDVGKIIINTMIFNISFPILEFIGFFSMRLGFRLLDRGLSCAAWKTRSKTIQGYIDIHSGPEYFIHYKYSFIMNICFITFAFGAGMPILFPIAMCSFIVLYIMERL